MQASEIANYLQVQGQMIDRYLEGLIPLRHGPYQHLFEAARYSLSTGGKRIRPILTLATVQMLGGLQEAALIPACALEIIHTYSLIHDDLPCMDDDDFRRGQPTLHKKYTEGHAVLTGDFLLTYAFELLATLPNFNADKKIKLIATLARHIGSEGMIGGQVMDVAFEGKKINLDSLTRLHKLKTGALITAAVEFGGILADATEIQMENLKQFGDQIGLAFQVVDDVLDITSSQAKHGRAVSSDLLNEKSTFVKLLGLEQSQAFAEELYHRAIKNLREFSEKSVVLISLADFIVHRKH